MVWVVVSTPESERRAVLLRGHVFDIAMLYARICNAGEGLSGKIRVVD